MKILWAKSGGILPLDSGGRIRSYYIATELARRHDVTMFTFYSSLATDPHESFREPFTALEYFPLDLSERASVGDMTAYALNSLTLRPYQMRKYCKPAVGRRLREMLRKERYDAIICDFLLTAPVVPWDGQIPTIMFTHNVEAAIWRRHFEVGRNPLWKLLAWREYKVWERAERHYTALADHVLTVSDDDRKAFMKFLPAGKVTTIPTGVDIDFFRPRADQAEDEQAIVFTGAMDWLPNEDAIEYFAAEILPIIRRTMPNVTLWVVGRKPTRKVVSIGETVPGVRVTGAVDDIRPYVHRAAVYVVPLRIGGGTRIKIFEAMGMGMPVVSTTVGAEGLPVTHDEDVVLADSPEDFAAQTIRLLKERETRARIGRAARRLVESRYGWSAVTNVLDDVLKKVQAQARVTPN
jgi:sugar transferase (PEP-CTERM/EpsH1 system associated)